MKKILLTMAMLSTAITGFSQDQNEPQTSGQFQPLSVATSGPYIGAVVGGGAPETPGDINVTDSSQPIIGGAAYGVMGGYQLALNPQFLLGVQIGYDREGQANFSYLMPIQNIKITATDSNILLTGTYLFSSTPGLNMFGKIGLAHLVETSDYSGLVNGSTTFSSNSPIIKIGAGYLISFGTSGSINIFGQYTHIFADNDSTAPVFGVITQTVSTDAFTAGVIYNIPL